jgi:hypothetical protein
MIRRNILSRLATAAVVAAAGTLGSGTLVTAAAQETVPTRIVVRVIANDAKIIGSGVGGAHVVIRNLESGEVLAQGVQEGGTGDTGLIMGARERHTTIFDTDGAAAFRAEIPLAEPTLVEIEARGPLGAAHATQIGTTTLLMIPGEHLDGEGVLMNLNGFTVELLDPEPAPFLAGAGDSVPVRAKVTMLCGCPTEPGGMWDSNDFDIRAQWVRDGRILAEATLSFSGTRSEYEGVLAAPAGAGPVTLRVIAVDADRANTGMVEATGRVR